LGEIRRKGVKLWSEDGQLHFRGPKGALSGEDLANLKAHSRQIVDLLEKVSASEPVEPRILPRSQPDHAPLSYSQLAHFHLFQLNLGRRSLRIVASALRLRGRLNIETLERSLSLVVARHEALRTRIVVHDGVPIQYISRSTDAAIAMEDLSGVAEGFRDIEVRRLLDHLILQPIDVTRGPMWEMKLLRLAKDEHVLIAAMEHLISDGTSINILFRDLLATYVHAMTGRAISLPPVTTQFPDYATWQRSTELSWVTAHAPYWKKRLHGCSRVRFRDDRAASVENRFGWGTLPIRIGRELKEDLRIWSCARKTTLVMTVFAVYAALVMRWCRVSDYVFQYLSNSRTSPDLENTIGYLASTLYLRMELRDNDKFSELVARAASEYCRAYQHADFSYLAAQVPRPEFMANSIFNWRPRGTSDIDTSGLKGGEYALTCAPVDFVFPIVSIFDIDIEPFILLADAQDEIVGDLYFPMHRFSITTMENFVRSFLGFLRVLVRHPEQRVKDIPVG